MRRSRFSSGESESSAASDEKIEWEMRPGGMLVQKRASKSDIPVPDLRLRVAYGTFRYEISIKSQATFGNLSFLLLLLLRVCNVFFFCSVVVCFVLKKSGFDSSTVHLDRRSWDPVDGIHNDHAVEVEC